MLLNIVKFYGSTIDYDCLDEMKNNKSDKEDCVLVNNSLSKN
ncbi:hypothetical protein [Methanobrevibacter arboriphilus]|nr:hypothetical protein [Methanobrevibacter arboriphilus]